MKSPIPAPNVTLMGDSGTGKTYALRTLIEAGITPFIIFTEPGMEVLGDLPKGSYHQHYISPAMSSFKGLMDMSKAVNRYDQKGLLSMVDKNKQKYQQFYELVEACNEFKCDLCGETFGDTMSWGTDRALVIDSLTGVNKMAMQLHIGGKVVRSQTDWGIAQEMIRKLLDLLTGSLRCWFVLTAHLSRDKDEIAGGTIVQMSSLGKALAPEIPAMFSDVVQTERKGGDFSWNTAGGSICCKARNLPIASNIDPTFSTIAKSWADRGGIIENSNPTEEKE